MKNAILPSLATLLAVGIASADGPLQVLISTTDTEVPGVPGAVWVPNQFNNPTVNASGQIAFRGQIGGTGITTANHFIVVRGAPGS